MPYHAKIRIVSAASTHHHHAPRIRISTGQFCFFALSLFCLILLVAHSDVAIIYMKQGLGLCAQTVIPSLFPFMVLSELLVASGGGMLLGTLCEAPLRRLFGISGNGACALLMGLICGFPVGAKTAVSLCKHGQIDDLELSRLLCFCNIPSSAFLINAVGVSLFGNRLFGIMLYGICLLSSLLIARLLHLLRPLSPRSDRSADTVSATGVSTFTHAVTSAAIAMLYVCAYVVFFSALVGTLGKILHGWRVGQTGIAALFGFFELSGGVMQASAIPNELLAKWLTALLCGWSGMSVHLQILSLCDGLPEGISPHARPYFFCKLLQGLLCALFSGTLLYFVPSLRVSSGDTHASSVLSSVFPFISTQKINVLLTFTLLIVTTLIMVKQRIFSKKRRNRHIADTLLPPRA